MSNLFIKPASIAIEGVQMVALVRDPETGKPLAAEGEWKVKSQFWNRRIRDRDVIESDPAAPTTALPPVDLGSPLDPVAFAVCANCMTPDACGRAARCVKAPLA